MSSSRWRRRLDDISSPNVALSLSLPCTAFARLLPPTFCCLPVPFFYHRTNHKTKKKPISASMKQRGKKNLFGAFFLLAAKPHRPSTSPFFALLLLLLPVFIRSIVKNAQFSVSSAKKIRRRRRKEHLEERERSQRARERGGLESRVKKTETRKKEKKRIQSLCALSFFLDAPRKRERRAPRKRRGGKGDVTALKGVLRRSFFCLFSFFLFFLFLRGREQLTVSKFVFFPSILNCVSLPADADRDPTRHARSRRPRPRALLISTCAR